METVTGRLVKDARRRAGLTQRQLAERARTAQSSIAAYETGRKNPSLATLIRILRAAGFDLRMKLGPIEGDEEAGRRHEAPWPSEVPEGFEGGQLEAGGR